MAKILSIEQKAACFDLIVETMKRYYSNLDEKLESGKPKKKVKEKTPVNIHFNTFWEKYPIERRVGSEAGTAKVRYLLTDEERTKAIDSIEPYRQKIRTAEKGLTYMLIPINYLLQKKRETFKSTGIDYTNLEIFHRHMRQNKEDLLREQLGEKYQEIKTNRKMSDLYLQP